MQHESPYQAAGTPCVGAHSTVRALYAAYREPLPLYQVCNGTFDNQTSTCMGPTKDIPVGPDGFADTSVQDSFCSGTTCTIPIIYDQSPNGNHLRVTWFANWLRNGASPADASRGQIIVGGHTVHGIFVGGSGGSNVGYRTGTQLPGTAAVTAGSTKVTFSLPQTLDKNTPLMFVAEVASCQTYSCSVYYTAADIFDSATATLTAGYTGPTSSSTVAWNQRTTGIATGDEPEAMYSVIDGTRYSQDCCFDYGNAVLNGVEDGNATEEAISWVYTQLGSGGGPGPTVAADLGNALFGLVPSNTRITPFPYVTAMLKGLSAGDCPGLLQPSGCFELKAGNATSGPLAIKFDADTMGYGARPPGYSPQMKQSALILGTGGDGSTGTGTWFEGAITAGVPPDATDDAVQANIVAAGYGR